MSDVKLDIKGIEVFQQILKTTKSKVLVGIMAEAGGKDHVDENGKSSGVTNADVGAAHEFGTERLPVRSWLRVPLNTYFYRNMRSAGAFSPAKLKELFATKSFSTWLAKAGAVGVATVNEAFNSEGNGTWPPSDMSRKTNHQTLVETHQLRDSVTYEVKNG